MGTSDIQQIIIGRPAKCQFAVVYHPRDQNYWLLDLYATEITPDHHLQMGPYLPFADVDAAITAAQFLQ